MISYDPLLRVDLGPLSVSPHGVFTAVGLLVGIRVALPAIRRRGVSDEETYEVVFPSVLAALVGARLVYVLNHVDSYETPLEALRVWEGGLSLLGGLIPAVLVAAFLLRRRRLPVWSLLDAVAPALATGIAVGRIGDLLIADHLGKPTTFVLGYVCPDVETGSPCVAPVGPGVHHTALYDLLAAAAIATVLLTLARRPHPEGGLILIFALLYGTARFLEGFTRIDVTHGTGLNGSQWTALVVVLGAAILLLRGRPGHGAARSDTPADGSAIPSGESPALQSEPPATGRPWKP